MIRLLFPLLLLLMCSMQAQSQVATGVRIQRPSLEQILGHAIATVNGADRLVSSYAFDAWVIDGGRAVVYSSTDGAGGFENEGQSLWRYDVANGNRRKLLTEYFVIYKVVQARTQSGRTALLVSMADGGLGAPHVAVADPIRGAVWRQRMARFVGVRNGRIAVGLYRVSDLERDMAARPYTIIYRDLDTLLARPANPYWPVGVPGRPSITGQITYKERIALPRNAVVHLRLVDVSQAVTPASVIAQRQFVTGGRQVPIPFELRYDPAKISSERRYEIQGRITVDGSLRFANSIPIITQENPSRDIEIMLVSP